MFQSLQHFDQCIALTRSAAKSEQRVICQQPDIFLCRFQLHENLLGNHCDTKASRDDIVMDFYRLVLHEN
jgi:hypothetical protein